MLTTDIFTLRKYNLTNGDVVLSFLLSSNSIVFSEVVSLSFTNDASFNWSNGCVSCTGDVSPCGVTLGCSADVKSNAAGFPFHV